MRRRYSRATALENIKRLREAIPNASFTTDLMVGFPGEEEDDFLDTLSFVREAGFLACHVFAYSGRRGTVAVNLPGQVSPQVKRERSDRLIREAARIGEEALRRHLKLRDLIPAVIESRDGEYYAAHSDSFVELRIPYTGEELTGAEALVRVVRTEGNVAFGEIAEIKNN
jgi:threonylcarbamoyladenosine tRNA methylthiotransferase MtaB